MSRLSHNVVQLRSPEHLAANAPGLLSAFNPSDVTVVIPTLNEAGCIGEAVRTAIPYCRNVLVVDGHSRDATAAEATAEGASVILDNKKGKGEALRCAIQKLVTPIVVFMDADGSHDPADIPRLVCPIAADLADHVVGSRLIGGSSELHGGFDEFMRLTGSSFITACINKRFNVRLSDSQNGFRALRVSALRTLPLKENDITIEQELLIQSLKNGLRVAEVPAHEHRRAHGASKVKLRRVIPKYAVSLTRLLFF